MKTRPVDVLNNLKGWVLWPQSYHLSEDEARTCIEALEQQKTGKWIPVSERLPRKGEYGKVLVTYIPSGGTLWTTVMIAHYSDLMGIAKPSFHVGEVGKESFQNITEQVTAWMPLPEPYKMNEESKE